MKNIQRITHATRHNRREVANKLRAMKRTPERYTSQIEVLEMLLDQLAYQ